VPGIRLIPTGFRCSVAVPFISVASTYVLCTLLAVFRLTLGCVRVDSVPSELAATFLSLRSIHLTPNPNSTKQPVMWPLFTPFRVVLLLVFLHLKSLRL